MSTTIHRRAFVRSSLTGAALLAAGRPLAAETPKKPKLKKAVKYAMIGAGKTVKEKLELIKKLGFKIAIEVVWNNFITKPQQLVEYVDSFKSPWVGAYFDCSNMIKYGVPPAEWIRQLGKRLLKFDFKGYSNKKGWVNIGEGDED